jgi:hypothetical protein
MPFDWMQKFLADRPKAPDYAAKTLAAYRLGIKSGGSLRGVRIQTGDAACAAARALPPEAVYTPDDAPILPLPACPLGGACGCVYRPVMAYEPPPAAEEGG